MEVKQVKIGAVKPYENNARFNDEAVEYVANSISEFGFQQPIVVDKDMVVIAGHTRLKAAKDLNFDTVPVVVADGLSDEQVKAYRLADNKTGEIAEWDFDKLNIELGELEPFDIDMQDFGFDIGGEEYGEKTLADKIKENPQDTNLADSFIFPPFSVLNTTRSEWTQRKDKWNNLGIRSEVGRVENLVFDKNLNIGSLNGTSIFDPVLTEILYRWFMPDKENGTKIYDPFAGGSVRGVVASVLGKDYFGIELRKEQVQANYDNANEIGLKNGVVWENDDSNNVDNYIEDGTQDFVIACPPYLDLEVYSDDPNDLSTMETEAFFNVYNDIIKKAALKLKDNRFAAVVVSDVRGKNGIYRDLTGETKKAMAAGGAQFYNDIVLLNSVGSGAMRARKTMRNRKVTRIHQNVLIFFKGNQNNIKNDFSVLKEVDKALEEYSAEDE